MQTVLVVYTWIVFCCMHQSSDAVSKSASVCMLMQGTYVWTLKQLLPGGPFDTCKCDSSLAFCYANSVVLTPISDFEADYWTVELLKIPAGESFAGAMLKQCTSYKLPHAPEEQLQAQTESEKLSLWHSVPEAIHERRSWWK